MEPRLVTAGYPASEPGALDALILPPPGAEPQKRASGSACGFRAGVRRGREEAPPAVPLRDGDPDRRTAGGSDDGDQPVEEQRRE